MAKLPVRIRDVKSWTPAIDARNTNEAFLLSGRNYAFDSKGPKSCFGTRLVVGNTSIESEGGVAQSIDIGNGSYVFTTTGVYRLADDKLSWTLLLDLTSFEHIIDKAQYEWTAAYLSNGIYFCHPVYGFYKLGLDQLHEKTQEDIAGLPFQPQAIAETNGRLIVLGKKYVGWSAQSNAEDFSPTLGGAGQQLLRERVAGNASTVAAFQTGFVVWTDKDCLIAEFIGGDLVFRFDRMETEQIPLGMFAVETIADGTQLICTKQGIYRIENGKAPEAATPIFNEFLREVINNEPGIYIRLTYMLEEDRLYVQIRDWTNHYVRTYVLALALDKWGVFSERHLGIIKYQRNRGSIGYVDKEGVVHRFEENAYNREVTPGVFEGLDSEIEVGYLRPQELLVEVDTLMEMQEILIGGRPARPQTGEGAALTTVDLGNAGDGGFIEQGYNLLKNGFYLVCSTGFDPDVLTAVRYDEFPVGLACGQDFQVFHGFVGEPLPAGIRSVCIGRTHAFDTRMILDEIWHRDTPTEEVIPYVDLEGG